MTLGSPPVLVLLLAAALAGSAPAQPAQPAQPALQADYTPLVNKLAETFRAARQFSYDAVIEVSRKSGENSPEVMARFKVKLAVAPGGRRLFWLGDGADLRHILVADGQHVWGYEPASGKFARIEAVIADPPSDPGKYFDNGVPDSERQLASSPDLLLPLVARIARRATLIELNRFADVVVNGEVQRLPILTVLAKDQQSASQELTELVVDPQTLTVHSFEWTRSTPSEEEPRHARLVVEFQKLSIGEPIPASFFTFTPPGNGEPPVEDLPVAGFTAPALHNAPAPLFELRHPDGRKSKLEDYRGKTVVLAFTAGGCEPCKSGIAALAKIQPEYKNKGLVVLGVTGDPKAAGAPQNSPVPLLADPDGKVRRQFSVRFLPTIVIINAKGDTVAFLPGRRDENALRAALATAGLEPESPRPASRAASLGERPDSR